MIVGASVVELHVEGCQSLKAKRGVIRSIVRRVRNRFNLAVAEIGGQDTWQYACSYGAPAPPARSVRNGARTRKTTSSRTSTGAGCRRRSKWSNSAREQPWESEAEGSGTRARGGGMTVSRRAAWIGASPGELARLLRQEFTDPAPGVLVTRPERLARTSPTRCVFLDGGRRGQGNGRRRGAPAVLDSACIPAPSAAGTPLSA